MALQQRTLIIASTAIGYFLLYQANFSLIGNTLNYAHRVDWIFLPSGLRLAFVLVFLLDGALGIALASMIITYQQYFDGDYVKLLVSGSLAGIGPYAAMQAASFILKLDEELTNLSSIGVFKLAVFFAFVSSLIHQLWYFWIGTNEQFVDTLIVMFIGDLLGSIVVLGFLQILLKGIRSFQRQMP